MMTTYYTLKQSSDAICHFTQQERYTGVKQQRRSVRQTHMQTDTQKIDTWIDHTDIDRYRHAYTQTDTHRQTNT